ncbi:hypothetical protein PQJ75_02965 [Rhodoplanes sp. TEM]|uniref:Heme exporter protein D n=1 Tax=Rhodoplanes tepidamans TaxID=200616 RepID=A0ABT5JDJ5_RHOTP|nr:MULTISPECIES: hypothetical protein [Rhodoplanes]MDC7787753.1 hypothetical protein [Rhodoplanes tepidamans]MDC7982684.1 hypothetical protein [Rhodoplanes sp. TEM]MDQ0357669.1 hypothetical protein [Rhodoplanes tepidamans]
MDEAGGWLWLLMNVGFVVVLAAALIWGTMRWRRRRTDAAARAERDRATLKSYRESDQNTAR